MKKSDFKIKFQIRHAKDYSLKSYIEKSLSDWKLNKNKVDDGVLLNIDQYQGRDDNILVGRGIGRFMLYFVQILCFCRNEKYELDLESSDESLQFYMKCNFVKEKVRRNCTLYRNLTGMRCESVISLKTDDNTSMLYLENRHGALLSEFKKRTLTNQDCRCYMNCCFQLLSYSFEGISAPEEITEQRKNIYKLKPEEYSDEIQSHISNFQDQYRDWFHKTFTQPTWKRQDRINALSSIVNIIQSIPKGLGTESIKEAYYPTSQEDAVEFIQFLLEHNPWDDLCTVHVLNQYTFYEDGSYTYICECDNDPVICPIIDAARDYPGKEKVLKLGNLLNHFFAHPYPEDYIINNRDDRIKRAIIKDLKKGAKLHGVYQVTGVSDKNKCNDDIPMRILVCRRSSTNEETLEDVMCAKTKIGTSYNKLKEISLILRGFVHYSPSAKLKSNSTQISQGHYITFIYLNDNQWLVLDDNHYFIVPAGYAFFCNARKYFGLRET